MRLVRRSATSRSAPSAKPESSTAAERRGGRPTSRARAVPRPSRRGVTERERDRPEADASIPTAPRRQIGRPPSRLAPTAIARRDARRTERELGARVPAPEARAHAQRPRSLARCSDQFEADRLRDRALPARRETRAERVQLEAARDVDARVRMRPRPVIGVRSPLSTSSTTCSRSPAASVGRRPSQTIEFGSKPRL